jgi:hypothetical protein
VATGLSIVETALRRIGAIASGESAQASETTDGLACLNMLIESWAAGDRLIVYSMTRTTWTIVSGTGAYTLGLLGTIAVARPVYINDLNVIDTSQTPDQEIDLGLVLTDQEYADIPDKALTADQPSRFHYNPTFPLGTVTFWPVPTSSTLLGAIYTEAQVTSIASLATTVTLPPGYERALIANLAVELAPEFGRPVDPGLMKIAADSKAAIKIANYQPIPLRCDPALIGRGGMGYDINIGTHR